MICKQVAKNPDTYRSSDWGQLMNYINGGQTTEKVLFSGALNMVSDTLNDRIAEMETVAYTGQSRSKYRLCKCPLVHTILSWREGENPSRKDIEAAIKIYLSVAGYQNLSVFYAVHRNTENIHAHLCINRFDPVSFQLVSEGWKVKNSIKASRLIEERLGFQKENAGLYYIDDNGKLIENAEMKLLRTVSGKVKDIEHKTGVKSGITIALERASSILLSAKTWKELHAQLQEQNIALIPRGKGGVLAIGDADVFVRLSAVSHLVSWPSLEKRLGKYVAPDHVVALASEKDQSLSQDGKSTQYLADRQKHLELRKLARDKASEYSLQEVKELKAKQAADRQVIVQDASLTKEQKDRSLQELALRHAIELDSLRFQQKERKKQITSRLKEFPIGYEEWLRHKGHETDAVRWRYGGALPDMITGGQSTVYVQPNPDETLGELKTQVRQLTLGRSLRSVVDYIDNDRIVFTDTGDSVNVYDHSSETSLRYALTLASRKWNHIKAEGSLAFVSAAAKTAAESNIPFNDTAQSQLAKAAKNVQDEELNAAAQLIKNDPEADRRALSLLEMFRRVSVATGGKYFSVIAARKHYKGLSLALSQLGGADKDDAYLKLRLASYLSKADRDQSTLHFAPSNPQYEYITVNGLNANSLKQMVQDKVVPSLVTKTADGQYQATLVIRKPLKHASALKRSLLAAFQNYYAGKDAKGVSLTKNTAPLPIAAGTDKEDPTIIMASDKGPVVLNLSFDDLRRFGITKYDAEDMLSDKLISMFGVDFLVDNITAAEAYHLHLIELIQDHRHMGEHSADIDWAKMDYEACKRLLCTGHSVKEVQEALEETIDLRKSGNIQDQSELYDDYAERIINAVTSPAGEEERLSVPNDVIESWKRIERQSVPKTETETQQRTPEDELIPERPVLRRARNQLGY